VGFGGGGHSQEDWDNDYLVDYNGVMCHALFNPFVGRYYVDDLYGVVKDAGARGGGAR
jgi:hypothetical protein